MKNKKKGNNNKKKKKAMKINTNDFNEKCSHDTTRNDTHNKN